MQLLRVLMRATLEGVDDLTLIESCKTFKTLGIPKAAYLSVNPIPAESTVSRGLVSDLGARATE